MGFECRQRHDSAWKQLRVALLANAKMREGAERLLEGYLTPNSDRAAIMIS
jgi:hypothetical protein